MVKSRINNRDNFSLLHLNIRSLQANLDRLTELLTLLSCSSSQFSFNNENYNFVHKHRTSSYGDGIGLYLSKQLQFKNRPDLCLESNNIAESLFIEICNPKRRKIHREILYSYYSKLWCLCLFVHVS
jgi:hypothetical protein